MIVIRLEPPVTGSMSAAEASTLGTAANAGSPPADPMAKTVFAVPYYAPSRVLKGAMVVAPQPGYRLKLAIWLPKAVIQGKNTLSVGTRLRARGRKAGRNRCTTSWECVAPQVSVPKVGRSMGLRCGVRSYAPGRPASAMDSTKRGRLCRWTMTSGRLNSRA